MDILRISGARQDQNSLVTLIAPMMTKTGIETRYLYGPVVMGRMDDESSKSPRGIRIGTVTERNDHIIVPLTAVLTIQECNKVLKIDNLLIVP